MTSPANSSPRPAVGDTVTINAPGEKYHGMTGTLAEDDHTDLPYFVRFKDTGAEWFTTDQVVLAARPKPGTHTHTSTTITIPRPATTAQIATALSRLDPTHEPTLHTYIDRIVICSTHATREDA